VVAKISSNKTIKDQFDKFPRALITLSRVYYKFKERILKKWKCCCAYEAVKPNSKLYRTESFKEKLGKLNHFSKWLEE
jgi:hypothetical protein